MLLDSNIVIYAVQPDHSALRKFIADHNPSVSAISYVEVLGYHNLEEQDRLYFKGFFHSTEMIDISEPILGQASLRQQRKMSLGDALIAGTALIDGGDSQCKRFFSRNVGQSVSSPLCPKG